MIDLGMVTSKRGKKYLASFKPDSKMLMVFGPISTNLYSPSTSSAPLAFNDIASSEEEAREKLNDAILMGKF